MRRITLYSLLFFTLSLSGCNWSGWHVMGEILGILANNSAPVVITCNELIVTNSGTTCNGFTCDVNSGSCDTTGCSCTMTGSVSIKK